MKNTTYIGSELSIFQHAHNWKSYYATQIKPLLGSTILEVGAGIGATTEFLCQETHTKWICLEPDPALLAVTKEKITSHKLPSCCYAKQGFLTDLESKEKFDAILFIDVLEHIEDDQTELENAALRLKPGGRIIVLSPAHDWLFSPFDQSIGHFRRYNKKSLKALSPAGLHLKSIKYYDCLGLFASLANKLILKSAMPSQKQIQFWDKKIIPLSKILDPVLGHQFGKTIIAVWQN